jgi:hypothetical protein
MFKRQKPRRDKIKTKEQRELISVLAVATLFLILLMVGLMWLLNR